MDTDSYIAFLVVSGLLVIVDAVIITISGRKYLADDDHPGISLAASWRGGGGRARGRRAPHTGGSRAGGIGPRCRAVPAASSHGFGVPEAVELAEVLDRRPERLVIYAVVVGDVGFGAGLSPAVDAVRAELG